MNELIESLVEEGICKEEAERIVQESEELGLLDPPVYMS